MRRGPFVGAARCGALVLAVSVGVGGCGTPRRVMTSEELSARAESESAASREQFGAAIGRLIAREEKHSESTGEAGVVNILAISGGGDWGAFGAGFLVGWGQVEDPRGRRPDFDAVSGVSTGALLAPFAYIGTDEACKQVEEFYRDPKKDWIQDRGLFFFLPYNPSFMTIPGLGRDVRSVMSMPFVEKLAAESRKGKVLVVSATDLDLARQRVWDIGAEAEEVAAGGDLGRLQKRLLASSAIPAVFPPVEIDGGLYADGGVTANILVRLDPRRPDGMLARWRAAHPDKPLPKVRYWLIFNNQRNHEPKTVQQRWPSIVEPSLLTSTRCASLAEMRWLAAQADYVNAVYKTDIEVRLVAIPDDWRPPVEGSFMKETMMSLSDLGRKMGADPKSWAVLAAPGDSAAALERIDVGR